MGCSFEVRHKISLFVMGSPAGFQSRFLRKNLKSLRKKNLVEAERELILLNLITTKQSN